MLTRLATCALAVLAVLVAIASSATDGPARAFCSYSLDDGWSSQGPAEYIVRKATESDPSGVPQAVRAIKAVLAVRADFDVYISMEDDNAAAMVAGGKKLLIVDVDFLDRLNSRAGTKWAAIQVIAHEVGHHIAGFSQSSHENELNADYWSGYILNRLGAAKDASTKAILTVGTDQDTPSHPNKHRRASTIAIGWDNGAAGSVDYEYCDGCE